MSSMNQYQQFIHLSRYARWREDLKRRETWEETVDRYVNFFRGQCPQIPEETFAEVRDAIYNLDVMPSMRALSAAGPALQREHLAGYNCAGVAITTPRIFSEIFYILLCSAGVGFSVERQFINQLPEIPETISKSEDVIRVGDSKEGWAESLDALITSLYLGLEPSWDLSEVRPAGARLKTFGGRASGPAPLNQLFHFVVKTFKEAVGRKLTSLECHDIVCMIAQITRVGGVRRSATISLSNLSDERMRHAKMGMWWEENPQRALANNSAVYIDKPKMSEFFPEWLSLFASKSGERGIFNRSAITRKAKRSGKRGFEGESFICNPCAEATGKHTGFLCNLSEIIVRAEDTPETLANKARIASIIGTMQSSLVNFGYVRDIWKQNHKEERLLGVSLTGIMDNALMNGSQDLEVLRKVLLDLRQVVNDTNAFYAEKLGINASTATTVIKPSGTVSALVGTASGIHPRHSPFYYRRVRGDKKDPLSQLMFMSGVPCEDDVMSPDTTWVFSFPHKSPEGSVYREHMSAIQHLELYRLYNEAWAEHAVSITVSVRDHEWLAVGDWVYQNFDEIVGVSFLPYSDHSYVQAPFEECTEEQYEELLAKMPEVNWESLHLYETEDHTTSSSEVACSGGNCEIL